MIQHLSCPLSRKLLYVLILNIAHYLSRESGMVAPSQGPSKPSVPDLFHLKRSYNFPRCKFGTTGEDHLELSGMIPTRGYTMTR